MRASAIIAALAATPLVAGRACGGHGGKHNHKSVSSSPAEAEPTPTIVSTEETYTEAPEVKDTPAVVENEEEEEEEEETTEEASYDTPIVEEAEEAEETETSPSDPGESGSGSTDALDMGTFSGISTFYSGDLSGGTCSFTTLSLPDGVSGVALSSDGWDPTYCGACVEITGPQGNKITAMVVDQCPTCSADHIDLFPDAFAELDDPDVGIIETSYEFVECGISSSMKLHNKDSTSAYWFAMQVVNHNVPIESLEVSTDGGDSWEGTERTYYNFFEKTGGFGTESVDVKIKSTTGEEMIVEGISIASDSETTCGGNF
ncbi:uncharacterized protein MKZ38_010393 [Zalerion maritima]|uniref:Expansin-like EG45 domain-containing protein n=1 Tax=Zalerion maritima TaxID=339359 RepID=A0AAD5RTJ7_9PEZI|nr:uncharacterized protein MKZ38_010393 [Zalerion maritima]